MAQFYPLEISEIKKETTESVSIAFNIPSNLKEDFKYTQGQYITLRLNLNGEELRRSYSICSGVDEDEPLRIGVKKVEGGKVSTYLNEEIEVGSSLEVMRPMGNFYTELNSQNQKNYVAFAAGSGITPILSIAKTTMSIEPQSTFKLFYGNRNAHSIMFKEELEKLESKYSSRFKIFNVLSRESNNNPLFKGRIDSGKAGQLLSTYCDIKSVDHFFICGPYEMIRGISNWLEENEILKEKILFELFQTPEDDSTDSQIEESERQEFSGSAEVTIHLDGDVSTLTLQGEDAILDVAIDAGLDVPYACQGGSCCTCRAKLLKGKVKMDANYVLSETELNQGYILTCQSHPTTPLVELDYDQ